MSHHNVPYDAGIRKKSKDWYTIRYEAGNQYLTTDKTQSQIQEEFGACNMTPPKIRYWADKIQNSTHQGSHGGARHWNYPPEVALGIRGAVWHRVNSRRRTASIVACQQAANRFLTTNFQGLYPRVSRDYIQRIFYSWRWSWQIPVHRQIEKYTPQNVSRYLAYVLHMDTIEDITRIKYMDEVHFASKGL
jgi:hypothetical protein